MKTLAELFLEKFGVKYGDYVVIHLVDGSKLEGVLMPKHMFSHEETVILKLKSGYNIGIHISKINRIEQAEYHEESSIPQVIRKRRSRRSDLPKVKILAVGGTILSKVDYRTGGVRSAVDPDELIDIIPEVLDIADIDTEIIMSKYSEHLTQDDWKYIAEKVFQAYREGWDGIVVLHGTDTLGYTSAALSFALKGIGIPVILVGSQRSSDRPSSDAAMNLLSALYLAGNFRYSGVYVAMHHSSSDDLVAVHIGTRVRKNHTSIRSAFQSIDVPPIAYIRNYSEVLYEAFIEELALKRRGEDTLDFKPLFSKRVALIKFYPGMSPEIFKFFINDYKAIVVEGTGLGHVSDKVISVLKDVIRSGVHVFMTSQCIWGRVNLNVYDTGRELLKIGVIPLENMLSETAYVKASWVIGNYGEDALAELMPVNIANEIIPRSFVRSR